MEPTGAFKADHVRIKGHCISFTHTILGVTVQLAGPGKLAANKMTKLQVTL